jgi:uncharacterized protein
MSFNFSRRGFLAGSAALAVPAAGAPAPKLAFRTLGKTGLKVTTVGYGCMITSDGSVIERAADMGITYFDTARGYSQGNNEKMVGAALGAKRKNIVLSSKSHTRTADGALKDLDTSLRELGTDHLDIWYLHAVGKPDEITDELLAAQLKAKQDGKIRFTGVSCHSGHKEVVTAALEKWKTEVLLLSYNFTMDNAVMAPLIESAAKAGVGVVGMKVMAGRLREGKDDKTIATLKRDGARIAALKWVINNKNVGTTIPSITDMEQLEENFRAMRETFETKDKEVLAAHLEQIGPLYCRSCGTCRDVCPKGLPVSDVLRYLTYAEGYGEFSLARDSFNTLSPEHAAVRCSDCTECAIQCPNGVRVPERLIRAQELFA